MVSSTSSSGPDTGTSSPATSSRTRSGIRRIGIDATCWWNRRGFGRFAVQLTQALLRRDPDSEYVLLVDRVPDAGDLPDVEVVNVAPGRTVTSAAVAGDRRTLADMRKFTRAVAHMRPDLFFYPAVYSFFPVPRRTRAVVCFHDTIAEEYPALVFPDWKNRLAWRLKSRLALWQAERIITVSESSRRSLVRHFGVVRERVDVITEGADPRFRRLPEATVQAVRRRYELAPGVPYLLYVGGLSPHKNLVTLVRAMHQVLRRLRVSLVLAGDLNADGFLANFVEIHEEVRRDALLRQHIRFTGFVEDEELVALYNGAHALVMPSLIEGFGLPALEAIACGTPVLASDRASLPEVVGEAGLLFDPREVDSVARVVLDSLEDTGRYQRLCDSTRRQAARFSWDRAADLTLQSFAQVTG